MNQAKDLTQEAPRSPRTEIGHYILLARAIDKGRAFLAGHIGEYHFDCPLDNMLFGFKGVKGEEIKDLLRKGASDHEVASWLDEHGLPKTKEEIKAWADGLEAYKPYENPEKKEWFAGECAKLNLDPAQTTLFDWLETDDKASYAHA